MSEYLVRWKFGADSLLNSSGVDTEWYQQFHANKHFAVKHYSDLLYHSSPSMKLTVEIFVLEQLIPGQPEPKDVVEEIEKVVEEPVEESRNDKIRRLYNKGLGMTRREIATEMGLSYQTVYGVTGLSPKKIRSQK